MDLKPKGGGVSFGGGGKWTFVLYPMEPLAQGGRLRLPSIGIA